MTFIASNGIKHSLCSLPLECTFSTYLQEEDRKAKSVLEIGREKKCHTLSLTQLLRGVEETDRE